LEGKSRVFLKGLLMGTCDIIPGISAGTIAFITGIYLRLINAIKSFSFVLAIDILAWIFGRGRNKNLREDIRKLDLGFLVTLLLGMLTAIILLSRVVSFLLASYFSFTMVFFVGLIIASAGTIFSHIERHHSANMIVALVGLALGVGLVFIVPSGITAPSLGYIFLGGFLAINAMMLPGISGSFILLVMGLYEFMLHAVGNARENSGVLILFIFGCWLRS